MIKGSSGFASCWSASQPKLFWDWSLTCSVACQIIFRQLPWNSHLAQINAAKWHGPLNKQCSYTSAAWVQQPNPSLQRAFVVFESTQAEDVRACPTAEDIVCSWAPVALLLSNELIHSQLLRLCHRKRLVLVIWASHVELDPQLSSGTTISSCLFLSTALQNSCHNKRVAPHILLSL